MEFNVKNFFELEEYKKSFLTKNNIYNPKFEAHIIIEHLLNIQKSKKIDLPSDDVLCSCKQILLNRAKRLDSIIA